MIKAPISLQDLRRSLYVRAKAEPSWRFWGLYVHVCKMETLWEAYRIQVQEDLRPTQVMFERCAVRADPVGLLLPFRLASCPP